MNGLRKGEPWGTPTTAPATFSIEGTDADLAAAWTREPGALIRFVPTRSDLAATLGLGRGREPSGIEVSIDVLEVESTGGVRFAIAHVVLGQAPQTLRAWHRRRPTTITTTSGTTSGTTRTTEPRAAATTGVVVLNAQHLAGLRVAPRGHPGDGRAEVQWYGLAPRDRAAMRSRLGPGEHLGHPDLGQASGQCVRLTSPVPRRLALDGEAVAKATIVTVTVRPAALRLLL